MGLQGEFILVRWGKSMYMSQQMYTLAACLANVNRALWGTFLQTIFYHSEGLDSSSLNMCPKPSGQAFRPPQKQGYVQMQSTGTQKGMP